MQKKIKALLKSNKKYRKSDAILMARVWYDHLSHKVGSMTALDLLMMLSKNELPNWESITRARRKIQSENPELRDEETFRLREERELEFRTRYSSRDTL
tara:strand:+ start:4550 stop:4846 length:297 start_codon:yes stop_codon:yes gene_type:complete